MNSKAKEKRNAWSFAFTVLALALCVYVLFASSISLPNAYIYRTFFTTMIMIMTFIVHPCKKDSRNSINMYVIIDIALVLIAVAIQVHILSDFSDFQMRYSSPTLADKILGFTMVLLVLEATRRTMGWPMVIIASVFMIIIRYAEYLPGAFQGPSVSFEQMISILFMGFDGIYGTPIQVMSSYIMLFIIFGSVLIKSGASDVFIKLALAIAGHLTGGPAKVAVLSSALTGTVSGSAVANVVMTGTFTIPLMKKAKYPPLFAGAVEAVASSGGMIMPPIMGAAAFIIAQFLGVPYLTVAKAAIIPAFLYYLAVYMAVHLEAKKLKLERLPKDELPELGPILKEGGYLFIPLILIVLVMILGFTPGRAAMLGVIVLFGLTFLKKSSRMDATGLLEVFEESAKSSLSVGCACACAGIIIGCVFAAGLGNRLTALFLTFSGGNLLLTAIFVMISCLILGMGLPVTATYIMVSIIGVPALIRMGIEPMAAHFFTFVFGIFSGITPPVAMAAFAAAGISGANTMRTGYTAFKIAMPLYFVPYCFLFFPGVLMMGTASNIISSLITCTIAVVSIVFAIEGYIFKKINFINRTILAVCGLLSFLHGVYGAIGGAVLATVMLINYYMAKKGEKESILA